MTAKIVSLVIPVYNESEVIYIFLNAVYAIIEKETYDFEFIFVNDGSTDNTFQCLLQARNQDQRIKIVDFSRNFGKELALAAGLKVATGEAVIPMDIDLQDPPEVLSLFLRQWENGYDVVVGVRQHRNSDSVFKRLSARYFYRLFKLMCDNSFIADAGDFRLIDRKALDALNSMQERVRFTKGMYSWVGFRQTHVLYERQARIAGSSKWSGWKLWNFAIDGITGFSTLPLRIWSYVGGVTACIGLLYAGYLFGRTVLFGSDLPGYPSLMVCLLTLGGLVLMSLGIQGEYLGRVYEEVKQRPLYVVRTYVGLSEPKSNICPHCGRTCS